MYVCMYVCMYLSFHLYVQYVGVSSLTKNSSLRLPNVRQLCIEQSLYRSLIIIIIIIIIIIVVVIIVIIYKVIIIVFIIIIIIVFFSLRHLQGQVTLRS